MDRDTLHQLLETAEERTVGYVRKWLENHEFRVFVSRPEDGEDGEQAAEMRRRRA